MARRKQRENYGNGSVSPEMRNGEPVRDSWRVCISLGTETYTDEQGRERKRRRKIQRTVHGSLDDARRVAKQLTADYESIDPDSATMTFRDACQSWVESMRNANTCSAVKLQDYENMMYQVSAKLGKKPLIEIRIQDVEGALATVNAERGHSQRRQRERFQTVKRIFEYCIDNGWILRNPCRGMKTPRVTKEVDRRSLTPEECARLRACLDRDELAAYTDFDAKEQRQFEWDAARPGHGKLFARSKLLGISQLSGLVAVRIMLATGCRRGEALALTWEHVDFKRGQITICQSLNPQMILKQPKTKKGIRTLAVDADTMAHLRKWKAFQKKALHLVMVEDEQGNRKPVEQTSKTPVCCNCKGRFYDPTKCAVWWRAYRAAIGFDTLKMHELRHTAATLALGAGMPIKDVQHRLGHASASLTLDIYGHAIPANDQAIAELMGAIMAAPANPNGQIVSIEQRTA